MRILRTKDVSKLRNKWLLEQKNKDAIIKENTKFPTLDHDHSTGLCRGVLDRDVNQFLGKVESAYKRFLRHKTNMHLADILREVSEYITSNRSIEEIIHPKDISTKIKRFSRFNSTKQKGILIDLGLDISKISDDKKSRSSEYKKFLSKHVYKF